MTLLRRLAVFVVVACSCATTPHQATREIPPWKTGFAFLEDTRLYYEELGSGRPLILLHGGLLDRRMWDDQFQELSRRFRVIRFDARGHGNSGAIADSFSRHDDLAHLMDALEIDKASLLGLSMGAYTSIDFALSHPQRVTSLVLASPGLTGYKHTSEALDENNRRLVAAIRENNLREVVELFQRSWTDGPHRTPSQVDPAVRERVRIMAMETASEYDFQSVERRLSPPAIGRLASLRAPTLVVVGTLDWPGIGDIAHIIEREVDGARVVSIDGAAHMVNMERPREFNEVVLRFLLAH